MARGTSSSYFVFAYLEHASALIKYMTFGRVDIVAGEGRDEDNSLGVD